VSINKTAQKISSVGKYRLRPCSRVWKHSDAQCPDNFGNGRVAWIAFTGKGLVQAFPVHSGEFGHFTHTLFLGEKTQSDKKNARVFIKKGVGKVLIYLVLTFQIIKWIPRACFCFHDSILLNPRHIHRPLDVCCLAGFITATQEQDDSGPDREVDPIAGADEKTQFKNTRADFFAITKIADGNTGKPFIDRQNRLPIPQFLQPEVEVRRSFNLVSHTGSRSLWAT